ncbi:MAG TPA: hypothetical protein VFR37_10575 [Longimicrobium sp.]|nr:hypothetical protein [Longimicrobium sp.]
MGATQWMYFTEYDTEPDRALHRLREEVFREGSYRRPWEFPDILSGLYQLPSLGWGARLKLWAIESLFTTIELVRWAFWGFRRPSSVDEAVAWAGEDGTHSIMDVERTGMYRAEGVAFPLSEPRLRSLFGTDRPTRETVEEKADELACSLARGEAVYFAVYHDGGPREIAFFGVSGD